MYYPTSAPSPCMLRLVPGIIVFLCGIARAERFPGAMAGMQADTLNETEDGCIADAAMHLNMSDQFTSRSALISLRSAVQTVMRRSSIDQKSAILFSLGLAFALFVVVLLWVCLNKRSEETQHDQEHPRAKRAVARAVTFKVCATSADADKPH
eukprot:TRINITY_DN10767_c0_g1_i1.p1 TRINITY_DN10767_c0_g1~~TRINITY_DN10767_c0_g1_i1.p1  ORF type:complete len:153 (+),score=12.57 TRINITY_DN10767_c0_g1_i1:47-505(+)